MPGLLFFFPVLRLSLSVILQRALSAEPEARLTRRSAVRRLHVLCGLPGPLRHVTAHGMLLSGVTSTPAHIEQPLKRPLRRKACSTARSDDRSIARASES